MELCFAPWRCKSPVLASKLIYDQNKELNVVYISEING